jgi:hypothetical protein
MKIDLAIVSTNENPLYYEFWEIVKNLWINLIGIKPILVDICDKDEKIDYGDYIIHKIKKIEGVNTGFQSQISRMFITKYYQNEVCLTSDIDMLPLSKEYFTKNIDQYDNESFLIFSSDAYGGSDRFPICYNASKGKYFSEILDLDTSFEDYCLKLLSLNNGWDTDELYFGKKINQFHDQSKIVKLKRGWSSGLADKRIDRAIWRYDVELLKQQHYIDCHSLRPYNQFNNEINQLINHLL